MAFGLAAERTLKPRPLPNDDSGGGASVFPAVAIRALFLRRRCRVLRRQEQQQLAEGGNQNARARMCRPRPRQRGYGAAASGGGGLLREVSQNSERVASWRPPTALKW